MRWNTANCSRSSCSSGRISGCFSRSVVNDRSNNALGSPASINAWQILHAAQSPTLCPTNPSTTYATNVFAGYRHATRDAEQKSQMELDTLILLRLLGLGISNRN